MIRDGLIDYYLEIKSFFDFEARLGRRSHDSIISALRARFRGLNAVERRIGRKRAAIRREIVTFFPEINVE